MRTSNNFLGSLMMSWGVIKMSCEEMGWRKGPWTAEEDALLIDYVKSNGEGRWNNVARLAGLKRNGKSCRLRWVNYLRPDLKRGQITPHEERVILDLHARWGNRWSTIARSLPGRTDNEIKNYWRTHFKKKSKSTSDCAERTRARLLRRQQFQLQQQQQQREQDQLAMKRIIASLLDEHENGDQPQNLSHPNSVVDEQGLVYSMISNCTAPESSNEEMVWEYGLWNLEDVHRNFTAGKAHFQQNLAFY